MSKRIAYIPLNSIDKLEIRVTNCKKTLSQVKKETGAAYILNGGMWNADGSPCPMLKVGGALLTKTWGAYGYGWNGGPDIKLESSPALFENFISVTCLIGPWGPVDKPSYQQKGQGGTRGRSAIGLKDGALCLYCSSDRSSDARTPEGLRDDLAALGWESAVMLDGGGSSMCDFDGAIMRGDGRKVHNWICVYTEKGGTEPPEGEDTMSKQYTVTPAIGVNIRSGPGTGYGKTGAYPCGTVVTVLEERDGWGRTDKGWVSLDYLEAVKAPQRTTDNGIAIQTDYIPKGRKNRPGGINLCSYLTIHETGNTARGADAEAHASYLKGDAAAKALVSWHYTVDDHAIVQHLLDTETAYHAGDGAKGPGNTKSIGIEICVDAGGNFEKAKENAAALVRLLMDEHSIPLERVVQHHHWNGKDCPWNIRNTPGSWDAFLDLCEGEEPPVSNLDTDVEALAQAGIIGSPAYWKTGSGYADANVVCLIHAMAEYIRKESN